MLNFVIMSSAFCSSVSNPSQTSRPSDPSHPILVPPTCPSHSYHPWVIKSQLSTNPWLLNH